MHAGKAALGHVVADPQHERVLDLLHGVCRQRDGGPGPRRVDERQLLLEAGPQPGEGAVGRGCHGLAIEHEAVVGAHGVHVDHRHARGLADPGEKAQADGGLSRVEGRGGGREDERGTRVEQLRHRVDGVAQPRGRFAFPPDVLADRDADPLAAEGGNPPLGGWLEVAGLVEHIVGGEERLRLRVQDLPVAEQRGSVHQASSRPAPVPVHVPHDDADPRGGGLLQPAQRLQVLLDEQVVLQQVHGRVAAQAQLGEHGKRRARRLRLPGEVRDLPAVPVEVPDRGVDLPAGDSHGNPPRSRT